MIFFEVGIMKLITEQLYPATHAWGKANVLLESMSLQVLVALVARRRP